MAFLLYLGQVSLYAFVLWGIYRLVWHNKPVLRGARVFLLIALLLPLLLPFLRLPASTGLLVPYRISLPEIRVGALTQSQAGTGLSPLSIAVWVYVCGCMLAALAFVRSDYRLHRQLRQGNATQCAGYRLITCTGIGPGTVGRTIFFPANEINELILHHELAHLHAGHRFDLWLMRLMQAVFWLSPAHWLIGKELKMVHEFEADAQAAKGADRRAYVALLLSQSMGVSLSLINAHSFFHHPLKRRIMMLQKNKHRVRSGRLLLQSGLLASAALGLCLLTQCQQKEKTAPVSASRNMALSSKSETSERPQSPTDSIYDFVQQNAEFPGDLNEYLSSNLRYPEGAHKAGKEGRVGIEFVVNQDGKVGSLRIVKSSGNPALDAEAKRVVANMPDWKPGMQDGRPVSVFYTIPISFQLEEK